MRKIILAFVFVFLFFSKVSGLGLPNKASGNFYCEDYFVDDGETLRNKEPLAVIPGLTYSFQVCAENSFIKDDARLHFEIRGDETVAEKDVKVSGNLKIFGFNFKLEGDYYLHEVSCPSLKKLEERYNVSFTCVIAPSSIGHEVGKTYYGENVNSELDLTVNYGCSQTELTERIRDYYGDYFSYYINNYQNVQDLGFYTVVGFVDGEGKRVLIKVVDQLSPEIIGPDEIDIRGEKKNIAEIVETFRVEDNYSENLNFTVVEDNYTANVRKKGRYSVILQAIDGNGNIGEKEVFINILEVYREPLEAEDIEISGLSCDNIDISKAIQASIEEPYAQFRIVSNNYLKATGEYQVTYEYQTEENNVSGKCLITIDEAKSYLANDYFSRDYQDTTWIYILVYSILFSGSVFFFGYKEIRKIIIDKRRS